MVYVMTNVSNVPFESGTGDAEACNYLQVGLRDLLEKVTGLENKQIETLSLKCNRKRGDWSQAEVLTNSLHQNHITADKSGSTAQRCWRWNQDVQGSNQPQNLLSEM